MHRTVNEQSLIHFISLFLNENIFAGASLINEKEFGDRKESYMMSFTHEICTLNLVIEILISNTCICSVK